MTDVVVIGAGLAGSATAWRLVQRGHAVTLLERSTPANAGGSSHGSARIFRYAYEDPFYAELVQQASLDWNELSQSCGQELFKPTGAVDFGELRQPMQLAAVMSQLSIEHEVLSAQQARTRWPQIAFDTEVLWHPGAGVIDAESAAVAMVGLARQSGAQVHTNCTVDSIARSSDGTFTVRLSGGAELAPSQVVVAAGAWLPDLLSRIDGAAEFISTLPGLSVRQEQVYHFPYRDPGAHWPSFIYKSSDIQIYGLPGGRDAGQRGLKVAEYNGGPEIPSATAASRLIDPVRRERVSAYVERYLPGLVPEPYAETTCLFTNTSNEDFIIDGRDGLTIVSPCSGHGAKFAPLIGRLAADAVTGDAPVPARFALAGR
jgi:sarcosine oxidase